MYGALSFGICTCRQTEIEATGKFHKGGYHPNIKIKKLNTAKHFIKCGMKYDGLDTHGNPKYADMCLEFLDTRQLAGALLGATCNKSLKSLCRMLGTEHQEKDSNGHGNIDEPYLDYARSDVTCTCELFVKLRDLYKKHGLTKRITDVYSEASIGKGYFGEVGVQSFFWLRSQTKDKYPQFRVRSPECRRGNGGYFGGRAQAGIRHKIMECMLPDFRSQYPTINALTKMQELLLAVSVSVDRGTNTPARRFLESVELGDFQRRDTWPKLRGFARIRPSDDVLPFRCEYESDDEELTSINVGFSFIKSSCDVWRSFADVCASKLTTRKCPEILETVEFVPHGQQTTKIIKIFGDPNYTVDPTRDDLFVKVIELRATVKQARDKHQKGSPEYDRPDAMQLALKLIASATSYGVLVEMIVDERAAEVPCMVYHGDKVSKRVARKTAITSEAEFSSGFKVEKPGKYFAPFGGLIPAGGRLMLAIAETLFRERDCHIFIATRTPRRV